MERRVFIGALAAATTLPRKWSSYFPLPASHARIAKVGIQLYTVRDMMKADFEGTLAKVAQVGYREVEFAGYFDHTPVQVRAVLDKNGLAAPSCHVGYDNTAEDKWPATLETVKAVGHQYVVCAWIPEEARGKTADDWKRVGDRFNKAGQAAQAAGVQFAYHNHNFEFVPLPDKQIPYDVLLANTDPKLVQLEVDLFWITFAGADPVGYFMKNMGRFPMVHVKDMIKKPSPDVTPDKVMVDVGKGSIDWKAIFAHSGHAGIQHYFVEHDQPPQPLVDIKTSFDYLNGLEF
ncbi:MAG TPA: sugar phosphate isomerase/epimerase [Gemmatimonadales bacterium]|nr:sugar phosphate isomerase/epimerase [Gemmatimonadales bacterium]